jgi:hypothetical protein
MALATVKFMRSEHEATADGFDAFTGWRRVIARAAAWHTESHPEEVTPQRLRV